MRERLDCAARLRARLAADPAAPWRISEHDLEHDRLGAAESVFAVGNGYVGVRGTPDEGVPAHDAGVVLNGFHETWPIEYPEDAYESLRMSKFVAYHWGEQASPALVERTLDRAAARGYDAVEAEHSAIVAGFWERSDVEIEGAPDVQQAVRFNLFQLLQATPATADAGVPAKGVTGHGYEGHYFWDTEIYVVPFLAHTTPEWAKQLLEFRCAMLPAARERAREVGHSGALFPWRTINGSEASAWYASGTAQYHINADIAHAMHQYNRVTGDLASCSTRAPR